MSLFNKIKYLYPNISNDDFRLQNDGDGDYIKEWTYADGDQPTKAELDAVPEAALQRPGIIFQINKIADAKVLSLAPKEKQFQLIAKGVNLLNKKGNWDADQQAQAQQLEDLLDTIEAIRKYEASLIEDVNNASDPSTVNIKSGWPV